MKKKLFFESISEYVDNVNSVDDLNGGVYLYSHTKAESVENIKKHGVTRAWSGSVSSHVSGYGLYTNTSLGDCLEYDRYGYYGKVILKCWIPGFERCIIMDNRSVSDSFGKGSTIMEALYGRVVSVEEQLRKFMPEEDMMELKANRGPEGYSSDLFDHILHENGIDGIVRYNVCVWKDYNRIMPVAVSYDNGGTWEDIRSQELIDRTLKTDEWNVYMGKELPQYKNNATYGYKTHMETPLINGLFKVINIDGKENLIRYDRETRDRKPILKVWCDSVNPEVNDGWVIVGIDGGMYNYNISTHILYDMDMCDNVSEAVVLGALMKANDDGTIDYIGDEQAAKYDF